MNLIKVSIKGTAPLLFHRYDGEAAKKGGKPDPNISDRELATPCLYTIDKKIYTPCEHIEGSMVQAGKQFKYKGRKTYMDFIKSGVFVKPVAIIHKNQEWEVDKRSVVIPTGKVRIERVRPMLPTWELNFDLEVINPDIDLKVLNQILIYAGQFIGIGDYRPKFGRFMISKFDFKTDTDK